MWPFSAWGGKTKRPLVRLVRGRYDAAQTNNDNSRHWANADTLSALGAITPEVRRILRSRARYEVANNSYACGIVQTLANDVIGTGPRLQMLTNNETGNRLIEAEFAAWATAVDLSGKLRTMRMARAQDGEAFCLLTTNDQLTSPVKLSLQLIEADQVASAMYGGIPLNTYTNDGIEFDAQGNPRSYEVLSTHPGDPVADTSQSRIIPAAYMIHWFRTDRPGQTRGIPDITPALPLFAQLRRYTLATLSAAEAVADIALVIQTTCPAGGEAAEGEDGEGLGGQTMEFERGAMKFLPDGWTGNQIRAEQPATTYEMFKREILNEIARCLNMPYNIAACNSSMYNYASGRLDHQTYYKSIRVEQAHCEAVVLDRIVAAWLAEAVLVLDELPSIEQTAHQWFWEGHEHIDPAKEAGAQAQRLASHTTTLKAEFARQGLDYETEITQAGKEAELLKKLGLTPAQVLPSAPEDREEQPQNGNEEDEENARERE